MCPHFMYQCVDFAYPRSSLVVGQEDSSDPQCNIVMQLEHV